MPAAACRSLSHVDKVVRPQPMVTWEGAVALSDIDTIVIVILENRSFDHMLGYLSLPDANPPMPVEGLRDDPAWLNNHANNDPRPSRTTIPPTALGSNVQTIDDPPHDARSIDTQIKT